MVITSLGERLLAREYYSNAEWSVVVTLKCSGTGEHVLYISGSHPVLAAQRFTFESGIEAWRNYIHACDYFSERVE